VLESQRKAVARASKSGGGGGGGEKASPPPPAVQTVAGIMFPRYEDYETVQSVIDNFEATEASKTQAEKDAEEEEDEVVPTLQHFSSPYFAIKGG
jgi:hypothetical protein